MDTSNMYNMIDIFIVLLLDLDQLNKHLIKHHKQDKRII